MSTGSQTKSDDQQHLQLLSVFYYIFGGLSLMASCLPLFYFGVGAAMVGGAFEEARGGPPKEVGWVIVGVGAALVLLGWTISGCIILAGRKLAHRESHTFCLVVAALLCLSVPLGTILGVFTIIVLMRPSVKELFDASAR
jgi:hypothetical protein